MTIEKARDISDVLGGEVHEAENGLWLVLIERPDGRVVTLTEDSIEEYADLEALVAGRCYCCISLK